MKIQTQVIFDSGTEDFVFSLKKQNYIEIDGVRHNIGEPQRRAVTPLDIDLAEDFIFDGNIPRDRSAASHPILNALNSLWTDDVKESYKAKVQHLEENTETVEHANEGSKTWEN